MSIIHDDQGYAKSPEDAVADVLKAGIVILFFSIVMLELAIVSKLNELVKYSSTSRNRSQFTVE